MKSIFLFPAFFLMLLLNTTNANNSSLNTNGDEPTFQDFLAQFPKASLPYHFEAEQLQAELNKTTRPRPTRLAWEYCQFLPMLEESARVNRMPVSPEPVAAFETPQFYAVLYNTGHAYTKNLKSYHISVFDKSGNHLATHFVAGVNPETITEATITENLLADIQSYQVNWAKTYQKGANDGNTIGIGLSTLSRLVVR